MATQLAAPISCVRFLPQFAVPDGDGDGREAPGAALAVAAEDALQIVHLNAGDGLPVTAAAAERVPLDSRATALCCGRQQHDDAAPVLVGTESGGLYAHAPWQWRPRQRQGARARPQLALSSAVAGVATGAAVSDGGELLLFRADAQREFAVTQRRADADAVGFTAVAAFSAAEYAAASVSGAVSLWDTRASVDSGPHAALEHRHARAAGGVVLALDANESLALGGTDRGEVIVWDRRRAHAPVAAPAASSASSLWPSTVSRAHDGPVLDVRCARGRSASHASCGADGRVYFGGREHRLGGDYARSVDLHEEGEMVAFGGDDGALQVKLLH